MSHQRHRQRHGPVFLSGALALAAATAWTGQAGPSFDCAKAKGTTETLICKDDGLAALDRKMAAAYAEALKRFSEEGYKDPHPGQHGWVKGCNDCWKSSDQPGCIKATYEERIRELEDK